MNSHTWTTLNYGTLSEARSQNDFCPIGEATYAFFSIRGRVIPV